MKFYIKDDTLIFNFLGKIIKRPFLYSRAKKNELHEKFIIANSVFWDADWYVKQYNHKFNRYEALDYWYRKGWKRGENPSKYINLNYCAKKLHGLNPISAYINPAHPRFFPDNKNNYKTALDSMYINEYIEYKKTRKAKSVVYTCITNDYDDLEEICTYKYVDKSWDYVCFTDNRRHIEKGQIGIWEVRPLNFSDCDNTRNNRWHKVFAYKLFPEYEESLYIDPNINILSNKLFNTVNNCNIKVPEHFKNLCIYQEYEDVLLSGLDDEKSILQELKYIKDSGMPQMYGFAENNVIYRRHDSVKINKIMDEWWDMIFQYSRRDQLSLVFLFWKYGINIDEITFKNPRLDYDNFYVFGHKKSCKNQIHRR